MKQERNQSIECTRLIASFFVVFIHCPFPNRFGQLVTGLGRFAVPLFFMISGYFSFGAGKEKLSGRAAQLFRLNLLGAALYALWRCLKAAHYGADLGTCLMQMVPTAPELVKWILVNDGPFAGHLWYLASSFVCTVVLLGYVRFFGERAVDYRPFYGICACLMAMQLVLGELASLLGMPVPYMLYRNALLMGLPLFGLGLFLGQYRQRLMENFALNDRKLLAAVLAGMVFSLLCAFGVGGVDLPIGTVAAVTALMLLMASHPRLTENWRLSRWIARFGKLSTAVYLLHLMVVEIYSIFLQSRFKTLLGSREDNLRPLVVLGITLMAAILWERLRAIRRRR